MLLYTWPWGDRIVGIPYPSAVQAIHSLAPRYRFAAVTARWQYARRNTVGWLTMAGLHDLPVIFSSSMHPKDTTRAAYKAAAIRHLRQEGWGPVIGVGDRPSDLEAYAAEGLRCFMVAHNAGSKHGSVYDIERLLKTEAALPGLLRDVRRDEAPLVAGATSSMPSSEAGSCNDQHQGRRSEVPQVLYFSDDVDVHQKAASDATWCPKLHKPSATSGSLDPTSPANSVIPPIWTQIQDLLDAEEQGKQLIQQQQQHQYSTRNDESR